MTPKYKIGDQFVNSIGSTVFVARINQSSANGDNNQYALSYGTFEPGLGGALIWSEWELDQYKKINTTRIIKSGY